MSVIKNCVCQFKAPVFRSWFKLPSPAYSSFQLVISHMALVDKGFNILTGPSGAGKSTFALALCGLHPVQKGFEWWFKGEDLAKLSPPRRNISLLFQTLELFSHLTALQNILFPIKAQQKKWFCADLSSHHQERLDLLINDLQLESFLHKKVAILSGGQKQRVALARALIVAPRFLILDEPFSFLDLALKKATIYLLNKIVVQDSLPVLLITHDVSATSHLGKVFYLQEGMLDNNSKKC